MLPQDDAKLRDTWIALYHLPEDSAERDQNFWAFIRVHDMCREDPERAWNLILSILAIDDSKRVEEVLSAGPLEDLLANRPYEIIERVEAEARINPKFAHLLGGVWQNAMPDDIWKRMQAVRDRRGWDGIHPA